jgi:hypothetical protein
MVMARAIPRKSGRRRETERGREDCTLEGGEVRWRREIGRENDVGTWEEGVLGKE